MAKKDPRQRNLIILLVIVISFGLFDFFMNMDDYLSFYSDKSKKSKTVKKEPLTTENNKNAVKEINPSTQEWGRDPFFDAALVVKEKKYVKKVKTIKLILKAISFSENMSVAMINSQVLAVGDKISGFRVKSIKQKQVHLEKDGQIKILKLQ